MAVIDHYIAHRLEREQQILATLAKGPNSIAGLRTAIYPELDRRLTDAAEIQLLAHLLKLETDGQVKREREEWALA